MEGANVYTVLISFVGGLASFLSPCVLPLVPGYISLISGVSIDHLKGEGASRSQARRAVILNSLAFNAGLSLIFLSLGAAAGLLGSAITSNRWVSLIGGIVIIVFGLHLIGILRISAFYRDTRKFSDEKPRGPLGSLVLGLAFAAGWTPCIGPILGGIIGLAASSGGWQSGLALSAFYAAGLAVPFLLTGLGINQFLGFYTRFRRHLHKVEVFSGAMLIVIGLMVATGTVTKISSFAASLPFNPEAWVERWSKGDGKTATAAPASAQLGSSGAAAANSNLPLLPDVEFKTLEGEPYRLSDLRGRVVVVNFWATWCGPCRGEIPEFNALQREHASRGLTIVGVTSDPEDTPAKIRTFQKDIPQEYTVLLGSGEAAEPFNNGPGLPVTHIVDREGRVRHKIFGPRDRAGFEALVRPLLEETAATTADARR
ncbi:MAG TPA: cytochrome c biogenesis protein/redoxin [Pyrinomonadaceae bacterium]|nr:cytochrome c biogenesis protein/redoxin [Pyrinomonadaceae bacterium]